MAAYSLSWFLEHSRTSWKISTERLCFLYAAPKMRTNPFLFSIKKRLSYTLPIWAGQPSASPDKRIMLEGQVIQNIGSASPQIRIYHKGEYDMRALLRTDRLRGLKATQRSGSVCPTRQTKEERWLAISLWLLSMSINGR